MVVNRYSFNVVSYELYVGLKLIADEIHKFAMRFSLAIKCAAIGTCKIALSGRFYIPVAANCKANFVAAYCGHTWRFSWNRGRRGRRAFSIARYVAAIRIAVAGFCHIPDSIFV